MGGTIIGTLYEGETLCNECAGEDFGDPLYSGVEEDEEAICAECGRVIGTIKY